MPPDAAPSDSTTRADPRGRDEDSCPKLRRKIKETPVERRTPGSANCVEVGPPLRRGQAGLTALAGSAIDANSTCSYAAAHENAQYWRTRRDVCRYSGYYVYKYNTQTGAELGRIYMQLTQLSYGANLPDWASELKIEVTQYDPILAGTSISGFANCVGDCVVRSGSSIPAQPLPGAGGVITATAQYSTTKTGTGAIGNATNQWITEFRFTTGNPPIIYGGTEFDPGTPTIRCDSATPGVSGFGCVYPGYIPTITYSRTGTVAELARHIGDAQASGLPGAWPSGTPLTRLAGPDDGQDNRDRACPDKLPRPTGKQCDEYPFASSNQGASKVTGVGRTFSYCQIIEYKQNQTGPDGFSACMIDRTQNLSGGGQLGVFYRTNRVIANDAFRVYISP